MVLMSLYAFFYHVFQKLLLFYSSIFVVFHVEHFIDFYLNKYSTCLLHESVMTTKRKIVEFIFERKKEILDNIENE